MLRDNQSEQWEACYEFIKRLVSGQARNISPDERDDIVHDTMIRIQRSLHTFRYECALSTWLFLLTRNRVIDFYRKRQHIELPLAALSDSHEDVEYEGEIIYVNTFTNVESICIQRENVEEVLQAIEKWIASTHTKAVRNRKILKMVLFQGRSLEEAAKAAGCSAAVASYVVRTARSYLRKKFRYGR